ncbi:hypothetical protein D3C77_689910 [compost metagenome]
MVTHGMTIQVVDPLEVVDIQHDHCQILTIALGPLKFGFEPLLEVTPVVDAGQRVRH